MAICEIDQPNGSFTGAEWSPFLSQLAFLPQALSIPLFPTALVLTLASFRTRASSISNAEGSLRCWTTNIPYRWEWIVRHKPAKLDITTCTNYRKMLQFPTNLSVLYMNQIKTQGTSGFKGCTNYYLGCRVPAITAGVPSNHTLWLFLWRPKILAYSGFFFSEFALFSLEVQKITTYC